MSDDVPDLKLNLDGSALGDLMAERDRLRAVANVAEVVLHHIMAGTLADHPERVDQLSTALLDIGVMGGSRTEGDE